MGTLMISSSHTINYSSITEMQAKVIASIIAHFCMYCKGSNTLLNLAGTISEASTSKSTNTTRELKMEISTGSSQANLLLSWVQSKTEMPDTDMANTQIN